MAIVFTSKQFIEKLKWLVNDVPNYYHSENGTWCNYNKANGKFMMDCVVSVKGLFWGFKADKNKPHGGGIIRSNGVPDFSCNGALNYCKGVSSDFSTIIPGEYACMKGTKYNHTGICIESATPNKRGKMFECTCGWNTKKCIISEFDIHGNRYYKGVKNVASWTKHGRLIWVDYKEQVDQVKLWQAYMNEQWDCGLVIDGSFGPLCEKAARAHQLYYLVKASIMVGWLQQRLIELGYSVGKCGVDRSFGPDTLAAVKKFQKDYGLKVDGIVGVETYKALTK